MEHDKVGGSEMIAVNFAAANDNEQIVFESSVMFDVKSALNLWLKDERFLGPVCRH